MFLECAGIFFSVISAASVFVCILDKYLAVNNKWRISEKTLFLLSLFGGAAAMHITMLIIHHKTRHKRFMIGLPFIFFSQVALIILILNIL